MLSNLLGNAVKFTEKGDVSIKARCLRSSDAEAMLEFAISDTGIGIASDKLPLLFREFSQIDSSISRRFGGTGLGLAICKRLVARMGGTIGAESRLDQGSTFRFTSQFKLAKAPLESVRTENLASPAREAVKAKIRVLVAEDNQTNQLVIRALLEKAGVRVDLVGNGLEAVSAVRERPYDLVLMDVMMPELDGVSATRQIRELPGEQSRVPIIGLTANVSEKDHAAFRAAGMDMVLTKPIRYRQVQELLSGGGWDGARGPMKSVDK